MIGAALDRVQLDAFALEEYRANQFILTGDPVLVDLGEQRLLRVALSKARLIDNWVALHNSRDHEPRSRKQPV